MGLYIHTGVSEVHGWNPLYFLVLIISASLYRVINIETERYYFADCKLRPLLSLLLEVICE